MNVFIFTVVLPDQLGQDRIIKDLDTSYSKDILYWTEKELNSRFSGEFPWKKISNFGVCAIQFINLNTIRLIVSASDHQQAELMMNTFACHLTPKKAHRAKFARRSPHLSKMLVFNSIASTRSLASR